MTLARGVACDEGVLTHVHNYLHPLLERIQTAEIDPSYIITHRMSLDDIAHGYDIFKHKEDECVKIMLKP